MNKTAIDLSATLKSHEIDLSALNPAVLTHSEQISLVIAKAFGASKLPLYMRDAVAKSYAGASSKSVYASLAELRAMQADITKSAVAPFALAGSEFAYASQAVGVQVLVPVINRSLVEMFVAMGAPNLPPNVRALTQNAMLSAVEIPEGGMYPAAAPAGDFVLRGPRKFGLIVAMNNELLVLNSPEVLAWVESNLTNAANNAVDKAVIDAMVAAAGTAQTTVKAAYAAFQGDLRTAVWVGSPETLGGLRSAAETQVSPNGGSWNGLPCLPVLAAPDGVLLLADAKRTAVYNGPLVIDSSEHADIVMDSTPDTAGSAAVSMFTTNTVAFRITKYADVKPLVNPVALNVA
ncbi:hypothetical protein [Paraburkholderia ginsengisoli]|uniref:Phage major capsid protein n=1 Tax=Paraburkholderia ginsengisoli TaxID=311231 RepID=A0A7T4T913_9BURK|nr:hypothetical protein [Paraburkholderia ginsengisoli]QQC64487.1 hypothetical protein I6I06_03115 [Paraburkholderia ginsengisoli]